MAYTILSDSGLNKFKKEDSIQLLENFSKFNKTINYIELQKIAAGRRSEKLELSQGRSPGNRKKCLTDQEKNSIDRAGCYNRKALEFIHGNIISTVGTNPFINGSPVLFLALCPNLGLIVASRRSRKATTSSKIPCSRAEIALERTEADMCERDRRRRKDGKYR